MLSKPNQEKEFYWTLKAGFLIRQARSSPGSNTKAYEVVKQLSDNITNTGGAVYLVKEQTEPMVSNGHPQIEAKSAGHNPAHMISGASK
jgi:hypothetical protein